MTVEEFEKELEHRAKVDRLIEKRDTYGIKSLTEREQLFLAFELHGFSCVTCGGKRTEKVHVQKPKNSKEQG